MSRTRIAMEVQATGYLGESKHLARLWSEVLHSKPRTLEWYKSIHFDTVPGFLNLPIEQCSSSVSIKGEVPCVH